MWSRYFNYRADILGYDLNVLLDRVAIAADRLTVLRWRTS